MVSVEDALAAVLGRVVPMPAAELPLQDALGLVLVEDVYAALDLPSFPAAVVDGFALRAADSGAARRIVGEQMAGAPVDLLVGPGSAVRITTGAPVPSGADVVIKVELADEDDGLVTPQQGETLLAGQNIRPVGSDIAAGELVLRAGQALGPAELGMLASLGRSRARVHRRPVVGVFSTGDELAEVGRPLGPGQIYDSNRATLLAAVAQAGGQPLDLGVLRDQPGELERGLALGLAQADVLVTSGGVSMGELDLLKPLLERWGTVHFGRVQMKPGKPLTFAMLPARGADGEITADLPARPVFALPGNPVSSLVTFQLFARPAIRRMLGFEHAGLPRLDATLGQRFRLDPERAEFHRVTLTREGRQIVARSTGSQASSRLLSTAGADGLLVLEQADGLLPPGVQRPVLLLNDNWLATAEDDRNE